MVTINYDAELRRAGASATHGWRRLAFLAQRHVLGAVGLIIMILFVLAALFADLICRYDPLTVDSAHALLHPDARHWMGTDSFGRATAPSRSIQRMRCGPRTRGPGGARIPSAATSGAVSSTARGFRSRSA